MDATFMRWMQFLLTYEGMIGNFLIPGQKQVLLRMIWKHKFRKGKNERLLCYIMARFLC